MSHRQQNLAKVGAYVADLAVIASVVAKQMTRLALVGAMVLDVLGETSGIGEHLAFLCYRS
jgi:hypothetical protein